MSHLKLLERLRPWLRFENGSLVDWLWDERLRPREGGGGIKPRAWVVWNNFQNLKGLHILCVWLCCVHMHVCKPTCRGLVNVKCLNYFCYFFFFLMRSLDWTESLSFDSKTRGHWVPRIYLSLYPNTEVAPSFLWVRDIYTSPQACLASPSLTEPSTLPPVYLILMPLAIWVWKQFHRCWKKVELEAEENRVQASGRVAQWLIQCLLSGGKGRFWGTALTDPVSVMFVSLPPRSPIKYRLLRPISVPYNQKNQFSGGLILF